VQIACSLVKPLTRWPSFFLADAEGRPRLSLSVKPSGEASVEFLNQDGKVTYSLPQQDSGKG
jgi:hypothetical protein